VDIQVKTDDKGVETPDVQLDIQPLSKKEGKARPEPEEISTDNQ
jgi:ATP-dependent Clp protease ATP-binding subunit ClpA